MISGSNEWLWTGDGNMNQKYWDHAGRIILKSTATSVWWPNALPASVTFWWCPDCRRWRRNCPFSRLGATLVNVDTMPSILRCPTFNCTVKKSNQIKLLEIGCDAGDATDATIFMASSKTLKFWIINPIAINSNLTKFNLMKSSIYLAFYSVENGLWIVIIFIANRSEWPFSQPYDNRNHRW